MASSSNSAPNRPTTAVPNPKLSITKAPGQGGAGQPNVPPAVSPATNPTTSVPGQDGVKAAGFRAGMAKAAAARAAEQQMAQVDDVDVALAVLKDMGVELTDEQTAKVAAARTKVQA